jgi:octaheme c-type cytochrome (tetrathionate reductase family)
MARRIRSAIEAVTAIAVLCWPRSAGAHTGDHRRYDVLQGPFQRGPDVTRACLSCHVKAARQVMATIHWTWVCPKTLERRIGKAAHVVNNFCIALPSNEPRCTSCHAGYGWRDKTFDFSAEENVDCLVCHDTTGTYRKFPTDAGHPAYERKVFGGRTWQPPDLAKVAQDVGKPTRETCGRCHFYGGGGEGVKHADLDASLFEPDRELDVHMDRAGLDFACQRCHTTQDHRIEGRCYSVPAAEDRKLEFPLTRTSHITCESCHGNVPHEDRKLDGHLDRVSCQACHVPRAARRQATKEWWDWSEAGRMGPDGKPYEKRDEHGRVVYATKKGEFRWSENFVPEYYWFNGAAEHHLLGDPIDDGNPPVSINKPQGDYHDPRARIWPMKVHRGKQPYDPVGKTLVVPKLFGPKGSGAYWKEFDWARSIEAGMAYVERPYSGEYAFIETEMYWPIAHMIAPAEDAVACGECHRRDGGRLADLTGFYLPGRDRFGWLDSLGMVGALGTILGVAAHGGLRAAGRRRRRKGCDGARRDEGEADVGGASRGEPAVDTVEAPEDREP